MNTRWVMVNVVWYDGSDAYVLKFVLQYDRAGEKLTPESEKKLQDYIISAGGELLKVDILYGMELENIMALKEAEQFELRAAFDRFKDMWF